ncbi:MAG: HigA family addiction module antidote protein [Candidatus Lambdaproteobacteria bacterium]|nr:HigA family addiction module antidote protein [Candidatus Lambdaproteobacteria bacterium]
MRRTKPLDPVPPGEILREEFMKPHGVSLTRLAREIGVPPGRISQILHDRRAITADTALRLGRYFGTSPQFWLALQSEHDLRRALLAVGAEVESGIRPLAG